MVLWQFQLMLGIRLIVANFRNYKVMKIVNCRKFSLGCKIYTNCNINFLKCSGFIVNPNPNPLWLMEAHTQFPQKVQEASALHWQDRSILKGR